jgi:hypothetical protein
MAAMVEMDQGFIAHAIPAFQFQTYSKVFWGQGKRE